MAKLEILRALTADYTEIGRLTELLLRVDPEERLNLVHRRGELVEKCQKAFEKASAADCGADAEKCAELEQQLHSMIISVITQDSLIEQELHKEKKELQSMLNGAPSRQKAAGSYSLHSRSGEL